MARTILVVDYDANWPALFAQEAQLLQAIVTDNLVNIEHIGSTAVPGLAAKPIIDILIEVSSLVALDKQSAAFASAGYQAKGENGIAGRRYFQKGGDNRSHHLHAFQTGDEHLLRHRAFRDYLCSHPQIAATYAELKKQAAAICQHDSHLYMQLKNGFIQEHQSKALDWLQPGV